MVKNETLLRFVLDSLSIFGENTKVSIIRHLTMEGLSFSAESFDIAKFCDSLQQILGTGADIIFHNISVKICVNEAISIDKLMEKDPELEQRELLLKVVEIAQNEAILIENGRED